MSEQLQAAQEEPRTLSTVRKLLSDYQGRIKEIVPRHLTGERLLRLAIMATSRNKDLLKCEPMSLVAAVVQAGRMGIEPDGTHNGGWLIPRWNRKTGRQEAQFQIGYGGKIDLVMRTGMYEEVTPRAVYEKDEFRYGWTEKGREFLHRPYPHKDRGPLVAVYLWTVRTTGHIIVDLMWRHECEEVRDNFGPRDKNDKLVGPWITDFDQMCLKTIVHRGTKSKPISIEFRQWQDEEDRIDAGETPSEVILDLPALSESDQMDESTKDGSRRLKERIENAKQAQQQQQPSEPKEDAPPAKKTKQPKPETKAPEAETKPPETTKEPEGPPARSDAPAPENPTPRRPSIDWE